MTMKNINSGDQQCIIEELINYRKVMPVSTEREGKRYTPSFEADTAIYVRDKWDGMREDDVYIASYPKTGTNWTMETVRRMYLLKDSSYKPTPDIPENIKFYFNALETGPKSKFELLDKLMPSKRVFFTHVDGETFPIEKARIKGAKIIYVLRNPKDQTVSWYHFTNKLPFFMNDPLFGEDWNNFTKNYFAGKQPTFVREGEWYPEHILSWYKHKNQPNVKFIYYEDMKKDFKKEIRGIAEFLNIELTDEEVVTVAHDCSFDVMKKQMDSHRNNLNMLRKGGIGGWKDYFTVAQSEAIDAEFADKLSNTNIKFTYQI